MGYRMPLADSGKAANQGPNNGIDVYLANIGANGDLGSCSGDRATAGKERRPAYCVVDNDFKEFGAAFSGTAQRRLKTLQATAAHEFFHAVQYAYTATMKNAEAWVTEGTATWMESRVFSTSVANHQYLELSALRNPETPLDGYGAWLFWQYLSERDGAGDKAIQQVWNDAANGHKTTAQVVTKLSSRYGSFGGVLADFGARTYGVEKFYANGSKYRKAVGDKRPPLDARHELNATRNSTDATGAPGAMRSLDMGARSISYVEIAAGKTGNLTVEVDLSTGTGWRLLLHRADGTFGNPITIAGGTHVVLVNQGDSVILVLGNGAGGVRTPKYRAVLP
jgi:hypothetical protein